MKSEISYLWDIGDDYYCDTCGPTNNKLILESFEDGVWQLFLFSGCYDSKSITTNDPDFFEVSEYIIAEAREYELFGDDEEMQLRDLIEKHIGSYE